MPLSMLSIFLGLGFKGVEPAATGRPFYHPSVLLKLYTYGYLNRVQSSLCLGRSVCQRIAHPLHTAAFLARGEHLGTSINLAI
jgi:hypothetical protein